MCDTILASPGSTAERTMLFGKNSDRQRNEAQAVEYFARADHELGDQLACTYITIPQVRRTHAVLLCRPFWIWGAEMGANEHGVAIGNEGLYARGPAPEQNALTGMDLLRLALERATTAAHAVEVIIILLEKHGQGGNCGHVKPTYYHNSFMIADAAEAFVLETIGREWLVERVSGVRAISNAYSIEQGAPRVSAGLMTLIRDSGWSAHAQPSYASVLADPHRQHIGTAGARRACSTSLLSSHDGRLGVADMMSILRDHGYGDRHHPEWQSECAVKQTVCMHAGADDCPAQTVGSMVSELRREYPVHWVTGTAAPCISIFKPVLLDVPLPPHGPLPTDRFDPHSLWWSHESLHRAAALRDFEKFLDDIRVPRDALEQEFRARLREVLDGGSIAERSRVIAACWQEAAEMESRWHALISAPSSLACTAYSSSWTAMNRLAGLDPHAREG